MRHAPAPRPILVIVLMVLSLALFVFALVKAARVSFSYDETWTYIGHVRAGLLYERAADGMRGNHHLLNVWGMMLARRLFGEGELALRSPNLLAYAGYLYATVRIVLRARTALLALAGWVLLNAHPYLIDFFCVARGYGIGCGALMLSLWCVTRFLADGHRLKDLMGAVAWAAIAAMAHLVLVNFLLAVVVVLAVSLARRARMDGLRAWRYHFAALFAIAAAGAAIVAPNALALFSTGPLGVGCGELWSCSLVALGGHLLYGQHGWPAPIMLLAVVIGAVGAVALVVSVHEGLRGLGASLAPAAAGLTILLMHVLILVVQHNASGVPYPEGRMNIMLVPLSAFVLVSFLIAFSGPRGWSAALAGLLAVPVAAHWVRSSDPDRTEEWRGSGGTRALLSTIAADRRPSTPERPAVVVGSDFDVSGSIGYYVHARHWHWLLVRDHAMPDSFPPCDYYLVSDASASVVDTAHWSLLFTDEAGGQRLYRDERYAAWRGERLHHQALVVNRMMHEEGDPQLEWTVPEGPGTPAPALVAASVEALEISDANWLTLSLDVHRGDRTVLHADVASHRQIPEYGKWSTVHLELPLREPLLPGDVVRFSIGPLHGPERGPVRIGSMDLYVSR